LFRYAYNGKTPIESEIIVVARQIAGTDKVVSVSTGTPA
jgi:hypothetical protein